jgi:hypothetical protein
MRTQIIKPQEIPNQEELEKNPCPNIREPLLEALIQSEKETEEKTPRWIPAVKVALEWPNDGGTDIILRISWEKDKWTVINRMKNHMEAFPETKKWFLVYYNSNIWFKVEKYNGKWDGDIKIAGIKYSIVPYEFSEKQIFDIENEKIGMKLSRLLCEDENGYPTLTEKELRKKDFREWKTKFVHVDGTKIQNEIEDTENLKKEVRNNWEKWDVVFDFTKEGQKFVLSVDREKRCLRFLTENLVFHTWIHKKYIKDGFCVWGWRVDMDEKNKTIRLYWSSFDYWFVPNEYREAMIKMLGKKFPDYQIIFW